MKAIDRPASAMQLLPPDPGKCPICAAEHAPDAPHNAQSLFYIFRFAAAHGRSPTWADAVAHCSAERARLWRDALTDRGHWTEPPSGVAPIAEPIDT